MPESLVIRPATPDDVPAILGFIRELAVYEKLLHEVEATEELLLTHLFGPQPKAHALIATWDDAPVGYALYFYNFSTFLARPGIYLEDLFVQPAYRARGIGKSLLVHLAQIATKENCGRLEWSVLDWNAPSIAFYKSLGALPMDEWTIMRVTGEALDNLAQH
jgi:GNAT superfamily N-acetyltransferase